MDTLWSATTRSCADNHARSCSKGSCSQGIVALLFPPVFYAQWEKSLPYRVWYSLNLHLLCRFYLLPSQNQILTRCYQGKNLLLARMTLRSMRSSPGSLERRAEASQMISVLLSGSLYYMLFKGIAWHNNLARSFLQNLPPCLVAGIAHTYKWWAACSGIFPGNSYEACNKCFQEPIPSFFPVYIQVVLKVHSHLAVYVFIDRLLCLS